MKLRLINSDNNVVLRARVGLLEACLVKVLYQQGLYLVDDPQRYSDEIVAEVVRALNLAEQVGQ